MGGGREGEEGGRRGKVNKVLVIFEKDILQVFHQL